MSLGFCPGSSVPRGDVTMVREVYGNELRKLLELYLHLHEETIPEMTEDVKNTWDTIIKCVCGRRLSRI